MDEYVIVPAGLGATIMLVIALVVNNIPKRRRYPEFWIRQQESGATFYPELLIGLRCFQSIAANPP